MKLYILDFGYDLFYCFANNKKQAIKVFGEDYSEKAELKEVNFCYYKSYHHVNTTDDKEIL